MSTASEIYGMYLSSKRVGRMVTFWNERLVTGETAKLTHYNFVSKRSQPTSFESAAGGSTIFCVACLDAVDREQHTRLHSTCVSQPRPIHYRRRDVPGCHRPHKYMSRSCVPPSLITYHNVAYPVVPSHSFDRVSR